MCVNSEAESQQRVFSVVYAVSAPAACVDEAFEADGGGVRGTERVGGSFAVGLVGSDSGGVGDIASAVCGAGSTTAAAATTTNYSPH